MLLNLNRTDYSAGTGYHTEAQTFGQFKEHLSLLTSIPKEQLIVKFGHPLIVLDYPDALPLTNIPIYDGADVVVTRRSMAAEPSTPSAVMSTDNSLIMPHTSASDPIYADKCEKNDSPDSLSFITEVLQTLYEEEEAKKKPKSINNCKLHNNTTENTTQVVDKENHISVEFGGGYLVRRVVPSDNSCLFTSIANSYGQKGITAQNLRQLVCDVIRKNPDEYSEIVLEMSIKDYCKWISKDSTWGGGIEMAAISEKLQIEICSVDTRTLRMLQFGQGKYLHRVILLYSGSHYDYVAFTYDPQNPRTFDQTMFHVQMPNSSALLDEVIKLAAKL
ncbi:OTU-domain-containing protein [Coemansia reversa NRRL 1564]|uniref:Ubiquitin thioesterase OTU n=1 Tax=Coemansia reversa (strain ATCC 12441 / NRRL 1564) TaxID=763665 RepID=A0A2G5BIV8_COERN|nr:OTU-domain-containing protein [Coemansia reversa NRRL 1564]|eukprot:PIA18960.1 OTU-domain-containing protein [Coemansia reversa NRRL 1564]